MPDSLEAMSLQEAQASPDSVSRPLTYKEAGVDIKEGNRFVNNVLRPLVRETRDHVVGKNGFDGEISKFGAYFDPKAAGFEDPILVMAMDGVGTKLQLAIEHERYENLGIDLVAMCVNDLLSQGAQPLAFLDYFAYARLEDGVQETLMRSIAAGCKQAGCALVGGETAQMPGFYKKGVFDLAGCVIGAIERNASFRHVHPALGDSLLALPSSGLHANGFSFVRKILERTKDLARNTEFLEDLLKPTRIYTKLLAPLIRDNLVSGIAHITGGGIWDNLPRIMREGQIAHVDLSAIERPRVFEVLKERGAIEESEMRRVFNCGVGAILSVRPEHEPEVRARLQQEGEKHVRKLGTIVEASSATEPPRIRYLD